jgi:pimeloyl-ACP methyl ester carboxylesterase
MKRTTLSDGLTIAYEDMGSGSPAIVFAHGAFANRDHYAPQIEHLSKRHRVLALDIRGHGESDTPPGSFGIREAAADVIAVCEAAGVDRAIVVGHSWAVPLQVAEQRPALVAGVVLLDGAVLMPEHERAQILKDFVPVLEGPGWAAAMQGFLVGNGFPHPAPALKRRVLEEIGHGPSQLAAQLMRDVMSTDWSEQLSSGSYPLLYVHGVIPADLRRLREVRPDAIVGAVAGGGHYISLEVPDQVNAMIDRFLELADQTQPSTETADGTQPEQQVTQQRDGAVTSGV